ncbi:MAG TPA: MBOAT family O-acyltransferase [Leptospiraceae bacterium]|nr:MBOAT family O-acyltransferase [Leptospiraceae bacterium]
MVFNSGVYIYFLIAVFTIYWAVSRLPRGAHRAQNTVLLLSSYFFYGWWDWLYLVLIFASPTLDYFVGIGLDSLTSERKRKLLITFSISCNLTILGIFKYYDFFITSFISMFRQFDPGAFPDGGAHLLLNAILPVGISFYTFQSMAYTVDVYRRQVRAERNFLDFASFVCFFPQLVAGPIERAGDLLVQMKNNRQFTWENMRNGAWMILLGFYMKTYVADNISPLVNLVYLDHKFAYHQNPLAASGHGGLQVILASVGFAFQIYSDFWGYSAIAMGSALFLGFKLTQNFNAPQMAENPADLWRRWHITLNRWVTDYIYIPLGGSRLGVVRKYVNLFVAMLLMGLWHGASWTFFVWGGFMGAWLIAHQIFRDYLPKLSEGAPAWKKGTVKALKMAATFGVFGLSATCFRAYDIHQTGELWKSILDISSYSLSPVHGVMGAGDFLWALVKKLIVLLVIDFMAYRTGSLYWIFDRPVWVRITLYSVLFFFVLILGEFGKDVIYFAF